MSKWYSFKELKRARTPMLLDSETGLPDNHVITVVERVISVDDPELIQNNVRTDTFTLNLDAEYDDLNVVVIFTKPNNINVKVAYNGTPTHIPGSAMELVGSLACSVVGIDADGEVRAVTKAAPDTFQVVKSGAYDGSVTSDDAELLGQILQAVSDAEAAITEAETATAAATNATSQATSAATSANQAASSANSAASSANSAATKANSAAVNAENAYETLQPYMATIDSCANILHREVGPDSVVTADDSFPCKPVEMVVYGNTVQNLWVNPVESSNFGVSLTHNSDGTFTLSGTANGPDIWFYATTYALKPNTQYTLSCSADWGPRVTVRIQENYDGGFDLHDVSSSRNSFTFTTRGNATSTQCVVSMQSNGSTASGTYRIMLNEGSTAEPWCPPGLNSVGQLREDEKNLWVNPSGTTSGVTAISNDDGTITLSGTNSAQGTVYVMSSDYILDVEEGETYTLSCSDLTSDHGISFGFMAVGYNDQNVQTPGDRALAAVNGTKLYSSFTIPSGTTKIQARVSVYAGVTVSGTYKVMLNKGSTAQPWVPPEFESCVQVVTAGKNLLKFQDDLQSLTINGVTFTPNEDGTITVNGTATANNTDYYLVGVTWTNRADVNLPASDLVFSTNGIAKMYGYDSDGASVISLILNNGQKQIEASKAQACAKILVYLSYDLGKGESNKRVYVQLEPGSTATDYEPPSITTTIDLQGHTLNALPDGTRDELHIDGGGNVVLEKRCGVDVAPTSAGEWTWDSSINRGRFYISSDAGSSAIDQTPYLMCDKLPVRRDENQTAYAIVANYLGLAKAESITGVDTAASVAGGAIYVYKLAEPQTIDLGTITPPTMAAPNVTAYVADDTPAEMKLDYVRDINIVVDRLEKKVADLVVTEATIV